MEKDKSKDREEVDLLFVFSLIKRIGQAIIRAIVLLIRLNLKYWRYFLLVCFIGILIGIGLGQYTKPIYRSESLMAINDQSIRNDYVESLVNDLSIVLGNRDFPLIEEMLGVNQEMAKEINDVSYEIFKPELLEDTIQSGVPFLIVTEVFNNNILDSLNRVILHYLETNNYFEKRRDIRKFKINSLVNNLEKSIIELDSLKKKIGFNLNTNSGAKLGQGFIFGEQIDPLNTYEKSISLFANKIEQINKLNFSDNFYIIKPFVAINDRANFGSFKWSVAVCVIIYFSLLIILTIRENLSKYNL